MILTVHLISSHASKTSVEIPAKFMIHVPVRQLARHQITDLYVDALKGGVAILMINASNVRYGNSKIISYYIPFL